VIPQEFFPPAGAPAAFVRRDTSEVTVFRQAGTKRQRLGIGIAAGAVAVGVFVGTLQFAEWGWRAPVLLEASGLTELEPVLALPRTASVLALLEAEYHLESGRPYSAWQALR